MINSKIKGKRGELLFCKEAKKYGFDCRRGQQYSGIGGEDIVGLYGIHVEVKFGEKIDIKKAMEQAVRDCGGKIPIVAVKKNYQPWRIIMRLPDLCILCGSVCKRDLHMMLVEMEGADWFKLYKNWRELGIGLVSIKGGENVHS